MTTKRRLALILILILLPVSAVASGYLSQFFREPELYTTGKEPLDLAAGDLNDDGYTDIVTANREGRSLSVFAGNGDGTLTHIQEVEVGLGVTSLTLSDFDVDGVLDVVATVCNYGCSKNAIELFRGDGDGTLTAAQHHDVTGVPYNILSHDFNEDGVSDYAASDAMENRILLMLSLEGSGEFETHSLPTEKRPISLSSGDINGDGKLDLLTANQWSDSITVYISRGQGEFEEPEHIAVEKLPYAVATEDLDGDTFGDVLVAHSDKVGRLQLYRGDAGGGLTLYDTLEAESPFIFVYPEDFDRDGQPDISVTHEKGSSVFVYLNQGGGEFSREPVAIPTGHQIYSLLVGYLDDDDYPDLAAVEFTQNILSVALGKDPEEYSP